MKNVERNKVIVGLDPGTTFSIAVLDLRGKLRKVMSRKHLSFDEVITYITEEGKPIIIATDKGKVPSAIEEISSNFEVEVFSPEEDLSIEKKKELTEGYDIEDLHQRDALASAFYAYNSWQNKFRNIESRMDELSLPSLIPDIKEFVVTGKAKNISEAIEKLMSGDEDDKLTEKPLINKEIPREELEDKIRNYRKSLMESRKDKERLKEHNEKLKGRIKDLESKVRSLKTDKRDLEDSRRDDIIEKEEVKKREKTIRSKKNEIKKLRSSISEMEDGLNRLKKFERLRKDGKIPFRLIENLSEDKIKEADRELSLEGSVIVLDEEGSTGEHTLSLLKDVGLKAVIGNFSEDFEDLLISNGIWVLGEEETEIGEEEGTKFIDRKTLEKSKKAGKGSFLDWLSRYRNRE